MTPPPPAADRRSTTRRVAAALTLISVVLCVAPSSSARQVRGLGTETTAANVTLQVIVTGTDGGVSVTGTGVTQVEPDLPDPCDVSWTRDNGKSCIYSVPEGTDVTLQRLGSGNLVRWSVYECAGTGPCTVKMDANRTVVATFTPTRLALVVEGSLDENEISGTVTSPEANLSCSGNGNCAKSVPAFAEVTFNATPVAEFEKWSGACQEAGTAPTCTLVLSGDDVVGAKFKDDEDEPEIIPPRQQAELRVVVEGGGKVVSSRSRLSEAIDCSPTCKARFEQGERPTLTAQGERFLEWRGGAPYCTTNPTCRYPAFGITSIKAVWSPATAPPPAPPPRPPDPTTTTRTTNPPPTVPPPRAAACTAKLLNVALLRQARARSLRLRVSTGCRANATMRLLHGKSAVVTRSYSLPQGRSSLRLGLPRALKRGWYVVAARFVPVGGKAVVVRRPFHFTP
jgi:hypothetical protein